MVRTLGVPGWNGEQFQFIHGPEDPAGHGGLVGFIHGPEDPAGHGGLVGNTFSSVK